MTLLASRHCSAGSTAFTTIRKDTLVRTQIDTIQKLRPVSYYLNEEGARRAARAKIDADYYFAQLKNTQKSLDNRTGDLFKTTLERDIALDQIKSEAIVIKRLKKELFWANFWKTTFATASAALTAKLIFF
ncbi:hypothetical protein [Dyadobacter diqingensis]|uniref:hypothetical protein n=1 Tax=Dyadobacter diqingensis TaxID=2938121 RepID=UPI0020C56ABE|nr:hypothetical protein [Dyadobacter diqingensis]